MGLLNHLGHWNLDEAFWKMIRRKEEGIDQLDGLEDEAPEKGLHFFYSFLTSVFIKGSGGEEK